MAVPARQLTPPAEPPGAFTPLQGLRFGLRDSPKTHPFTPIDWRDGFARWAAEGVIPRLHHADLRFKIPDGTFQLHLLMDNRPRRGQRSFIGLRIDECLLMEPMDTSGFDRHLCVDDLRGFGLGLLELKQESVDNVHIFGSGRKGPSLIGHHTSWHLCLKEYPSGPRVRVWRDPPSSR